MMPLLHHYLAILKLYFELILKLKCRTTIMVLLHIKDVAKQTSFFFFWVSILKIPAIQYDL